MEAASTPQRGQGHGEFKDEERWGAKGMVNSRTRKDGGRHGRELDRRRWRMGWEVRGGGTEFRGAVDWGRREGRAGSRLTSLTGKRKDPERREHRRTGDRRV